ncbi:MAG: signal peptidase II [Halioglobus sp.]|jgi:signal peptidase II
MVPERGAGLSNSIRLLWCYGFALFIVLLDLYTKNLATQELVYARPVEILSWFNLTLHHNTGAAFSFLSEAGGWQRYFFSIVAGVISAVLAVWIFKLEKGQWLLALSLSLILGGALGNLWDRLTLGYVVDFISVHYAGRYFPTFNIADSAISVGAVCMLLESFLQKNELASE